MKIFTTALSLILLVVCASIGQEFDTPLPRYATPDEIFQIKKIAPGEHSFRGISEPPRGPVRAMAEWEELQALVITWNGQNAILAEIVRAAREETEVIICCNTQTMINSAKTYLTNKGVDFSSKVTFLLASNNSIWVRDYGPNSVYVNDIDSLAIVDWIYNRPRPLDDALPEKVATHLKLPFYQTFTPPYDLVHTGGNFMSDGMGLGFSSDLVLAENGPTGQFGISKHSEDGVDSIMNLFMGIHTYPKMTPLPYDVIHHIDMHMKLLDEETLLVGEYPSSIADGPQIEANIQYVLDNFKTSFGTPFKVVRIPMPPEGTQYPNAGGDYRTYANAVFVNKTVILPTYEEKYDTTAIRIWQEAMPGYKIQGINCNTIIPSLGAIHCITKEVGVSDPLRIVHKKLEDVEDNAVPGYPVFATIKHRSGIEKASCFWTTDFAEGWKKLDMTKVPGDTANVWETMIPVQAPGSTVYYYIEGTANSGRSQVRPMPAPAGYWKFKIKNFSGVSALDEPIKMQAVFPNPARAITCIPVFSAAKTDATLRVFDVLGRPVMTVFEGKMQAGEQKYFLDASRLASGTYFVELAAGGKKIMQKLIVE